MDSSSPASACETPRGVPGSATPTYSSLTTLSLDLSCREFRFPGIADTAGIDGADIFSQSVQIFENLGDQGNRNSSGSSSWKNNTSQS